MSATAIETSSTYVTEVPESALSPHELLLVDTIADRIFGLLRATPEPADLVDAAALAAVLGVSRDYVYAHADELGGIRIGSGPRGRLRFDVNRAHAAWTTCSNSNEPHTTETPGPTGKSHCRRDKRMGSIAPLLPIRGPEIDFQAGKEAA